MRYTDKCFAKTTYTLLKYKCFVSNNYIHLEQSNEQSIGRDGEDTLVDNPIDKVKSKDCPTIIGQMTTKLDISVHVQKLALHVNFISICECIQIYN